MSPPVQPEASADPNSQTHRSTDRSSRRVSLSDRAFFVCLSIISGTYVLLIVAMLAADAWYVAEKTIDAAAGKGHSLSALFLENPIAEALADRRIRYSIWLSLISCSLSAVLSLVVAVPMGYLLSRHNFFGKRLLDAVLDIPIVLPPLVVGLSLLILFQFAPLAFVAGRVVHQIPAVVLAQFSVACAFAVRTMKSTFDHITPRCEHVAISLGCTRAQAFGMVVLPDASRGMLTALTLAWARSLGEFGPLLVFAGMTRMKTEVLSMTVYLELSVGNIEAAVAVSLIMVVAAVTVLIVARRFGAHLEEAETTADARHRS
ncbi:MAG: ABC transporter permease [Planctomycetaceae bacterium]